MSLATSNDATYQELVERIDYQERDDSTRALFFGQRAYRDLTSMSLSADSERVYAILDCGMLGAIDSSTPFIAPGQHPRGPFEQNSLIAYSLRGGKIEWEIGGRRTNVDDPLHGWFLLGAPLVHRGQLLCLVEDRGEARLLVLDPTTAPPTLLWSQSLQTLSPSATQIRERQELRRTSNIGLAATGDVVICTAGDGIVSAIDLGRRQFLWVSSYRLEAPGQQADARLLALRRARNSVRSEAPESALERLLGEDRWHDATPLIVDGHVFVPAIDSATLICFRLADGERLWEQPRGDWLALAGAGNGVLFLVGEQGLDALRIADGTPAWDESLQVGAPAGYGVRSGKRYLLPLVSGEIATIDLSTPRVLAKTPLPAGRVPGNLVTAGGRLVYQSATEVAAFTALANVEAELAGAVPDDQLSASALALRGQMRLQAGETTAGVADLRRALELEDHPLTRRLLVGIEMSNLRGDFAAHRDAAESLDRLVSGTPEELEFRRLYASALRSAGEPIAAMRQYLRWGQLLTATGGLERIDSERQVAPEQWLAAEVRELYDSVDEPTRGQIDQLIGDAVDDAVSQPRDVAELALSRLELLARPTPLAERARLELARRSSQRSRLQQEGQWLPLLGSSDSKVQGEAIARLTELYLQSEVARPLPGWIARLEGEFADIPLLDERSGRDLLDEWRKDRDVARLLVATDGPPVQPPLEVIEDSAVRAERHREVPVVGGCDGPLAGWSFEWDVDRLYAFDDWGRHLWTTNLRRPRTGIQTPASALLQAGHLLVVVHDEQFIMIDALKGDGARSRQKLATQTLQSTPTDISEFRGVEVRHDRMGNILGVVGPLVDDRLCFLLGNELTMIEARTQRPIWKRSLSFRVSEIVGDAEAIVVRPAGGGPLQVYSPLDGRLLATRPLPPATVRTPIGINWGRRLLSVVQDTTADTMTFSLYDPLTDREEWTYTGPAKSRWSVVDGRDLLIVRGDGRYWWTSPLAKPVSMSR
ncbi:MAG: PQQ-binding-like beta-propeller repeat protein [Planctomycetaceae bacterium]